MRKILSFIILTMITVKAFPATVVATVNDVPITDADITARVELMTKQGNTSATNRRQAFQNIIDDNIKLNYAANFNIKPTEKDADKELAKMNLGTLSSTAKAMARLAMRSDIAWQTIIARTIVPTIEISDSDIKAEKISIAKEHGLPIELTMLRLVNIPKDVAKKLTTPKNCDDAIKQVENLGGNPQKITALQYELAESMRERVADLPVLKWSPVVDDSIILICDTKKTSEYKNLDEIIKQNAIFKKASFMSDQQLKQLRRKAVIIINDDRYKL